MGCSARERRRRRGGVDQNRRPKAKRVKTLPGTCQPLTTESHLGIGLHGEEHGANGRLVNDGIGIPTARAPPSARMLLRSLAYHSEFEGILGRRDALHRSADARGVDEGEHVAHAFVLRADQPPFRVVELELARR